MISQLSIRREVASVLVILFVASSIVPAVTIATAVGSGVGSGDDTATRISDTTFFGPAPIPPPSDDDDDNEVTGGKESGSDSNVDNKYPKNPVAKTIKDFKSKGIGWKKLPGKKKKKVRGVLKEMAKQQKGGGLSASKRSHYILTIDEIFVKSLGEKKNNKRFKAISRTIRDNFNAKGKLGYGRGKPIPFPSIDIPNLMDAKLKALADSFKEGAVNILTNMYNLAFKTPVPENSGWKGVLGTPVDTKANQTFYTLYQQLLVEKLYPVTYSLLSIGIVFMAISMAGNPFMSHHQVVDYFIKLVLGIMYWAFAWTGVTLMHGVVNDITMWLRPSPEVMGALITNVEALAAGSVAAYFVGSGGILATLFTLSVEFGMRRVLLMYVFPYIFPVLLLVLYLSPWRHLRRYASMGIWQYVNVLTMVIPMAILLKAAAVVSLGLENKSDIVAMAILVALFAIAMIIPFITTYLYIQMPGTAKKVAKKGAKKARGRLGDPREKLGWGGDGSASESTATGSTSPGDRGEAALVAVTDANSGSGSGSGLGFSGSGTARSTSDTTASRVRKFYKHTHSDPMSDEAMLEAYSEDNSRASTLQEKRQEKNN
jgi:hypothetical protein